jgi:hypothetical protein
MLEQERNFKVIPGLLLAAFSSLACDGARGGPGMPYAIVQSRDIGGIPTVLAIDLPQRPCIPAIEAVQVQERGWSTGFSGGDSKKGRVVSRTLSIGCE